MPDEEPTEELPEEQSEELSAQSPDKPDEDPTKGVSALRIGTTAVAGTGGGTGQDRTD